MTCSLLHPSAFTLILNISVQCQSPRAPNSLVMVKKRRTDQSTLSLCHIAPAQAHLVVERVVPAVEIATVTLPNVPVITPCEYL